MAKENLDNNDRGINSNDIEHQSISDLVKEGNKLLKQELKSKSKIESKSISNSTENKKLKSNPYYIAKVKVFNSYPEWKQKELLDMEKYNNVNSRSYSEFVKEIIAEGDSLTSS